MQAANHLRSHAVNPEGHQFVAVGDVEALGPQVVNELGVDAEDAEGDQLAGVEAAEMLAFHLARELEAHILHRHGKLLVLADRKPERLHLARIVWIGLKVEQARAFAVLEKSFAVDLAGIARNGEVDLLFSGLREIHSLKHTRRPVGAVVRLASMVTLDQREFNLAGNVRFADSPVAAAHLRGTIRNGGEKDNAPKYKESKRATQSHKSSPTANVAPANVAPAHVATDTFVRPSEAKPRAAHPGLR